MMGQSVERQGTAFSIQGAENGASTNHAPAPADLGLGARMRELEIENARLKSLVGELLVANQMLRERRDQA
jgi:hypothetical protein